MTLTPQSVLAVASIGGGPPPPSWREAVRLLEDPPQLLPGDGDGLESALRSHHEWIWVLDGASHPAADALSPLLAAARSVGDDSHTTIIAGMVVDQAGAPIRALLAAGREHETALVVAMSEQRLLPIRQAGLANTLVHRDALLTHGLPLYERLGRHAAHEWTTRVLASTAGYLAPTSFATAMQYDASPRSEALIEDLRMWRTGTWNRGDTLKAATNAVRSLKPGNEVRPRGS